MHFSPSLFVLYAWPIHPLITLNGVVGGSHSSVADDPGLTECATASLDE